MCFRNKKQFIKLTLCFLVENSGKDLKEQHTHNKTCKIVILCWLLLQGGWHYPGGLLANY